MLSYDIKSSLCYILRTFRYTGQFAFSCAHFTTYKPEFVDEVTMKTFSFLKSICCGGMPSSSDSDCCSESDKTAVKGGDKKEERSEEQRSDILCSSTNRYLLQNYTGEGSFGVVAKGVNLITSQDVALKILKTEETSDREINMLEIVSVLDPVKKNVVQFYEAFKFEEHTCLVFELLDRSLFQLCAEGNCEPLSLCEIRPITHQLLTALDALKGIGVIHSDLKPSNIMLTNHPKEPFRVKVIDFGLAFSTSEKICGETVQPLGYRAPEVILGLPISEAIDMWGLGCVFLFLYLGIHPFSIHCEYQSLKGIVDAVGQPDDHVLCAGKFTHKFFTENQHLDNPRWWFKTTTEYQFANGIQPRVRRGAFRRLDDLIVHYPDIQESIELEDQRSFVSLLRCLLHTDPWRRITPEKALTHPFVTMAHLQNEKDISLYVTDSFDKMLVCQKDDLAEEASPSVIPQSDDAGSVLSIKIMLHLLEEAQGAAGGEAAGPAVEETAGSQVTAIPAEGAPPKAGLTEEGPLLKVKRSRLRRIRKFFGRTIRTLLGLNKEE
uniref:Protein kinase domain-containing protein n=1 Tax=Seriola dumerili TaxID=41447 RepID=A0A3B4T9I5_SERDU